MRRIAVVTVGRSDLEILRPVLNALADRTDADYGLIVSGTHLVAAYGDSDEAIRNNRHPVFDSIDMIMAADSATAASISMGVGITAFARSFTRIAPDLIIILGDRFDTFAAAASAVPLGTPLLHIHGGETSEGAMDERLRHAITKLSHIHCVATKLSAERVLQMGEEPWRVHVTGAPGIDNLLSEPLMGRQEFFSSLRIADPGAFVLATFHPVTMEPDAAARHIETVLSALREIGLPVLFTMANSDPGGHVINRKIQEAAGVDPARVWFIPSLGRRYRSAMAHAALMAGNSSSGIIEACSLGLPVVNIGQRQAGRERSANVMDCSCDHEEIVAAVRMSLQPEARRMAGSAKNVYGDGAAGRRIAAIAAETPIDDALRIKRFRMP